MKAIIKKILIQIVGPIKTHLMLRQLWYFRSYFTGHFARFGIDKVLWNLMPYENGYYVELGANDGALASNSFFFELKKSWKGILIEPAPNLYLECVQRRARNNKVYCNACVPFDFDREFVKLTYMGSMTISDNLEKDINIDEFMERGRVNLVPGETVFQFGAKAATLTSLLIKANAPQIIDFISLDVEGAELDVLKGIDFNKYKFKYMVIESRNIEKIRLFLLKHNYELQEKITHHDYIFHYPMLTEADREMSLDRP